MDIQTREIVVSIFMTMLLLMICAIIADCHALFGEIDDSAIVKNYFYILDISFCSFVFIKVVTSSTDYQVIKHVKVWKGITLRYFTVKNYLTAVTLIQLVFVIYSLAFVLDYSYYITYLKHLAINVTIITISYIASKLENKFR